MREGGHGPLMVKVQRNAHFVLLFQGYPFWQRMLVVGIYGKVMLYKYVSCWIVGEGACIMAGKFLIGHTPGLKRMMMT